MIIPYLIIQLNFLQDVIQHGTIKLNSLMEVLMQNVLFVCLGNICRSPMAEAMFQQLINQANLQTNIQTESVATSNWEEGNPPHPGAQHILAEHGLSIANHRSRPITTADYEQADWIITMDRQNVANLRELLPTNQHHKIHLAYDIIPAEVGKEIPDPWYSHNFALTYRQLAEVLPLWLAKVQESLS